MEQWDEIDKKIFSVLKHNANVSSIEMAQQLNIFAPTIRRRIQRMLKSNLIHIQAIRMNRLESSIQVVIFFRVESSEISSIAEFLKSQPETEVVMLLAGHYNVAIWCYFELVEAYSKFLNNIIYPMGNIQEMETHIRTQFKKYAFNKVTHTKNPMRKTTVHFDDTDMQIISRLEENAYHNVKNLAKTLNISAATIRRRMNNLLNNNIICIQAFPNFHRSKWIPALILLKVNNDMLNSISECLAEVDEVRNVYIFMGEYDICVYAWFESIESFNHFLTDNLSQLQGVLDKKVCIQTEIRKWVHK